MATIVHVDIDKSEIIKSNPRTRIGIVCDSSNFLNTVANLILKIKPNINEWSEFLLEIKQNGSFLQITEVFGKH
jgi:thiamine pyrophosphate-dependent acetolactate synthase large subunit-like protein